MQPADLRRIASGQRPGAREHRQRPIDGINAFDRVSQGTSDIASPAANVEYGARLVYDERVEESEDLRWIGGAQVIAIHHALVLKTRRVLLTERLGTGNHRLAPSNNSPLGATISLPLEAREMVRGTGQVCALKERNLHLSVQV